MNRRTMVTLAALAVVIAIAASVGISAGLNWEQQRHPPLPPQASKVGELIIQGNSGSGSAGLRQTTYRVPMTVEDVRRFYQQELARLGWRYCGTQATPDCTTKQQLSAEAPQTDVYQRMSVTVEILATWNAEQRQTTVTVVEAVAE
jgi:hypothetical protein